MTTYREKFNERYGFEKDESHSLNDISRLTGYSRSGLQTIFNKGVGAYFTNPESVRPQVNSPEQWAYARVYSAVMGGPTARIDAKHLKKSISLS
jgi:hypothetical protein